MQCDVCAKILEQRISKMEGVESVVTDLPNNQVTVKGVMDQAVLVDIVQRKMRRTAVIVAGEEEKQEEEKKQDQDEKKVDDTKADDGHANEHKYEFWPPARYYVDYVHHFPPAPAPLTDEFSEENPNACAIM
jgi:copper chaperone CopZ